MHARKEANLTLDPFPEFEDNVSIAKVTPMFIDLSTIILLVNWNVPYLQYITG